MHLSHWAQFTMAAVAVMCFINGWTISAPVGDAIGFVDAFEKLVSYIVAALVLLIAAVWYMVGR